jgi:glycerol-3-phosphate acyltransferase PlsX
MLKPITIALDAMGGDRGPEAVLAGAEQALARHPDMRFLLVGNHALVAPELAHYPALSEQCTIQHAELAVAMDAKPSEALRRGRWKSSMWLAIDAVKTGRAAFAVSGGNTGALMAMSKFCLKTMPGIERPAIAAIWPTVKAECLVLDVGATVEASAEQLVTFAFLGAAMARALQKRDRPTVALLNIGVEEVKGLEAIKQAHGLLRAMQLPFEYMGFVEADRIGHDAADVVVTDGFTGNVAIKTAEGTAKQVAAYLRAAMEQSLWSQLGGFIAQDGFRILKAKMDPRRSNGGVFLGLNGLVIKSHGGADATGYASAIDLGYDMAQADLVERARQDLGLAQNAANGRAARSQQELESSG